MLTLFLQPPSPQGEAYSLVNMGPSSRSAEAQEAPNAADADSEAAAAPLVNGNASANGDVEQVTASQTSASYG